MQPQAQTTTRGFLVVVDSAGTVAPKRWRIAIQGTLAAELF